MDSLEYRRVVPTSESPTIRPAPSSEARNTAAEAISSGVPFDLSFRIDSVTNRNYCACLSSVLSPVKLRVAPLVRASRAIVEKTVASTQNTGPRMLGQTGV